MLATLQRLGVVPSFSRPQVSDDNPYSESLFRTMKYRPGYPKQPFSSLNTAQAWVDGFVNWGGVGVRLAKLQSWARFWEWPVDIVSISLVHATT